MARVPSSVFSALVPFGLLAIPAYAGDLRVQLLDSNTGKPVPGLHLFVADAQHVNRHLNANKYGTDETGSDGTLTITIPDASLSSLTVYVEWHRLCTTEFHPPFSIPTIVKDGLVAPNGCKHSVSARPTPGTLTIFVREENIWEKMSH